MNTEKHPMQDSNAKKKQLKRKLDRDESEKTKNTEKTPEDNCEQTT